MYRNSLRLLPTAALASCFLAPPGAVPFDLREAAVEHLQREVGVLAIDHQRRHQAQRAEAAAENNQAALKGHLNPLVALVGGVFLGCAITHQLNADHQPPAANIAN